MNITKSNFKFLRDLARNNNREWFNKNKDRYTEAHENTIGFAEDVLSRMAKIDQIVQTTGKKSLHRIYRDTRFSKDKTPYKTHWSGGFARATKRRRGGYYFHLHPGNKSFVGGGFWGPNSADLLHIRKQIESDPTLLRKILRSASFKSTFGQLQGEQLKTAPKGFPKDHPDLDLLRYKSFIVRAPFSDADVLSDAFSAQLVKTFKKMRPFFDYMSEILTTDLNGESLLANDE
ncbi:MAG: DUF2461 domain-containing protein [Rhodothermales bacterium]|nr:DUF2461 domain-containing protein [Rhodothermales bacterium]